MTVKDDLIHSAALTASSVITVCLLGLLGWTAKTMLQVSQDITEIRTRLEYQDNHVDHRSREIYELRLEVERLKREAAMGERPKPKIRPEDWELYRDAVQQKIRRKE